MRYEAESFCYISPADFEGQNPRVGDLLDFSEVRVYRKSADEEPTDITDEQISGLYLQSMITKHGWKQKDRMKLRFRHCCVQAAGIQRYACLRRKI